MGSDNQLRTIDTSFSLKNPYPSYLASDGKFLITVIFTLQFLFVLKSFIAGKIDCWRVSIPMTSFSLASWLKRASLTSGDSSRSSYKKIGRIDSLVFCILTIGARLSIFSARAILTNEKLSLLKLSSVGKIWFAISSVSGISSSFVILYTATVLTSFSESFKNPM